MTDQLNLFAARQTPLPPTTWADTSKAAAARVAPHAPNLADRVAAYVSSRGDGGATIEEITAALRMRQSSVCGRIGELARPKKGAPRIVDSGRRRAGTSGHAHKVWVAAQGGSR